MRSVADATPSLPWLLHWMELKKGVGLEFMDAASSSARAPGRVELQQLRRKAQSALGRLARPRPCCTLVGRRGVDIGVWPPV